MYYGPEFCSRAFDAWAYRNGVTSPRENRFVMPACGAPLDDQEIVPHYGRPGGVLPRVSDARIEGDE